MFQWTRIRIQTWIRQSPALNEVCLIALTRTSTDTHVMGVIWPRIQTCYYSQHIRYGG